MRYLSLVILCFFGLSIFAQPSYEDTMKKGFELWQEGKTQEASGLFERVAQAETDNWVPAYYAANVLIASSFSVDSVSLRNAMLEKAVKLIRMADERSPENSEILTLEGVLFTSYVAMDPQMYAMKYSNKIMNLHQKAVELDASNPRAQANAIEYEMGSAKFFKQDLTPYCERMKKVIPLFENQKSDIPFAPSYGIDRAMEVVNACDEKTD